MNIYALSSGSGPSGIAIIRISGPNTLEICNLITKSKKLHSNKINFCKFYNPLINQISHFANVIAGNDEPLVSGREGLRTLQVIEAIQIAAEKKEGVQVSNLFEATPSS